MNSPPLQAKDDGKPEVIQHYSNPLSLSTQNTSKPGVISRQEADGRQLRIHLGPVMARKPTPITVQSRHRGQRCVRLGVVSTSLSQIPQACTLMRTCPLHLAWESRPQQSQNRPLALELAPLSLVLPLLLSLPCLSSEISHLAVAKAIPHSWCDVSDLTRLYPSDS